MMPSYLFDIFLIPVWKITDLDPNFKGVWGAGRGWGGEEGGVYPIPIYNKSGKIGCFGLRITYGTSNK